MIATNPSMMVCPYDVGDVLITASSKDPAIRWVGTQWVQIKDKFLLGAGDSYKVGTTGGEAQHTLTVSEIPSHAHPIIYGDSKYTQSAKKDTMTTTGWSEHWREVSSPIASTGGSQAHNNMPPYQAFYFWQRTA